MLALTVREGDYVTIGDDIVVQVLKTGDVFRIAIEAPKSMDTGPVSGACARRMGPRNPTTGAQGCYGNTVSPGLRRPAEI